MTRAHRLALLSLAALFAGACADILDLTDKKDVVEQFCGPCNTIASCADRLGSALDTASDADREAWFETYEQLGCANATCDGPVLLECFYSAPGLCAQKDEPCEGPEACCDHESESGEAKTCCVGGGDGACCATCSPCAALLGDLEDDADPDVAGLCASQRATWEALEQCLADACGDKCTPPVTIGCGACLANACPAEKTACNEDQGS